jgi:hypothetical protein
LPPEILNNGTLTNASSGFFSNDSNIVNAIGGSVVNYGNLFLVSDGSLKSTGTISNSGVLLNDGLLLNNAGGLIVNTGMLTNAGNFTNEGMIMNSFGATLDTVFFINAGVLNNAGTMNNDSSPGVNGFFTNSGVLNNSGTFTNPGTFTNSGVVVISSAGLFTTSTNYKQTAGKTLVNGTFTATDGAIVDIQGGILGGTGTINSDVLLNGILSPGSGGVPGTLTINGNYEQGSTGIFEELISGASSNGVLDVSGILTLDPGSLLEITLQGGFDPLGDSFTIMNYGSLLGEFSNAPLFFADGFEWTVTYGANDAVLTAVEAPEPGTMFLLSLGFLTLLFGYAAKRREQPQDDQRHSGYPSWDSSGF